MKHCGPCALLGGGRRGRWPAVLCIKPSNPLVKHTLRAHHHDAHRHNYLDTAVACLLHLFWFVFACLLRDLPTHSLSSFTHQKQGYQHPFDPPPILQDTQCDPPCIGAVAVDLPGAAVEVSVADEVSYLIDNPFPHPPSPFPIPSLLSPLPFSVSYFLFSFLYINRRWRRRTLWSRPRV